MRISPVSTCPPPRLIRSGRYTAYIPDLLVGRAFTLDGQVAADVADAERAIARLDHTVTALANTETLAGLLLRAEAVASSHIEGLHVSAQRLPRAGVELAERGRSGDITAMDVLANVDAMNYAVSDPSGAITLERILEVHRLLLTNSRAEAHAGVLRTDQNWIRGNGFNPIGAAFVPPPPENVERLLADLCAFCNGDALPAVAQAAVAHAQFEIASRQPHVIFGKSSWASAA
jgi:Fic family protein